MRLKISCSTLLMLFVNIFTGRSQETVYPAPAQINPVYLTNATIHIGNGQVINNGTIGFSNGKITVVMANGTVSDKNAQIIDCKGEHIYPGLIVPATNLGLVEVPTVKATTDFTETGEITPSVRSIVAYNVDSKVINTLRSNGILLANIVPEGGLISGTSAVVQLDAWNYADATYKSPAGIHVFLPRRNASMDDDGAESGASGNASQQLQQAMNKLNAFLREGRAYVNEPVHKEVNLNFEALRSLFAGKQKLFVHCASVKEMLMTIELAREFKIAVVIVGGRDSWMIADQLRQNNIAVILDQPNSLPFTQDDDIDQPFKTPAQLQQAGVLFCIGMNGFWQQRNLMFNAGTAAAYGLKKEEALSAITFNTARILGIDDQTGTLEAGKDANIIVSRGDILDMLSSIPERAYIQGRVLDLSNKQTQLYERYKHHYNIK